MGEVKIGRNSDRYYMGIDAGSVSLNCVVINQDREIIHIEPYKRHLGRVEEDVLGLVERVYRKFGKDNIKATAFTGNHGHKFAEKVGCFYEFETICEVIGALFIRPDTRTIISMGGQDIALFQVNHEEDTWELEHFNTNGPCASGTGSFIDQQAQRLATSLYTKETKISQDETDRILTDFIVLGLMSERPAEVACRCTVFTKSDMIHLQNKGEKLEDIIYGLHVGNARNYMSTIVCNRILEDPILFIGGLSMNQLQVRAFKSYFSELVVPEHNTLVGAIGVALQAMDLNVENRLDLQETKGTEYKDIPDYSVARKLELKVTEFPEENEVTKRFFPKKEKVYLGIDVGSTTTKYALINENLEIIHKHYVHTKGKPVEVTQTLLRTIRDEIGDKIIIMGTATTGSGRNYVT